ncbi:hypothetical protein OE88DRAFT_1678024 [Heliocybe sulcata]|uniref:Uncharacterized protein n=1 Tax=Heliocybe sulcata TaxID=5364 RepID=A0A5C3N7D2_9AGAM|nr:hypothetical protein OE88DRAFT_1678024 [Heliocybe sulcata]
MSLRAWRTTIVRQCFALSATPYEANSLLLSPVPLLPAIYSSAFISTSAFNDITNGTNPGCGTVGFNAEPGWDPFTGLSTSNFVKLLSRWLLMP